jgi:subtilase family serine protease
MFGAKFAIIAAVNLYRGMKFRKIFFAAGLAAVFLSGMICFPVAAQTARQNFRLHVLDEVSHLQPVGQPPATKQLNLAISLPLRNRAELDELIRQIYDPASTNYHRYLTPEQFTARFGPTEADYQQVIAFAQANNLTVTAQHPNRAVLDVAGPVANVEKTFHVTMRTYQHPKERRTFFAPDAEPSVDLTVPILHVSGLDDFALPHPASLVKSASAITPNGTGSIGGAFAGNDFRAAYVPGTALTGAGQTVALLQFDGYFTNDIVTYENLAGLPAVTLTNVAIDGGVSTPGGGVSEVSLDIEMVISMAPGVSQIVVYEAPNPSPWVDLLSRIANDNLAKQISCSWGGGSPDAGSEQAFVQMAAQGQSFFCASGDSDAFTGGAIDFPAESTNITQVGGTTLTTTGAGGAYVSETVWNWGLHNGSYVGSSGGISPTYPIPSYQQGISMTANHGSTTKRNIPDVALTGDNVYVVYSNGLAAIFGGTSCAAPLWAGFMAIENEQAATAGRASGGFINPAIYAIGKGTNYAGCFHDITVSNNFWPSSPTNFPAVPGYDLCTGWGTPAGQFLMNTLAGPPEPMGVLPDAAFITAVGFQGGPFSASSQIVTLTNFSTSPLNWSIINTSSWLNVSASSGTLAAGGQTTVTVSLNSAVNNFATGTFAATIGFSNQASGILQNRQFTLQVSEPLALLATNGFSVSGPAGGLFYPGMQNVLFTNLSAVPQNWSLINTSAWLSVSAGSGLISGNGLGSVTLATNATTAALASGIYNATLLLSNQTSHLIHNLPFSVNVGQSLVQNGGFETGDLTSWTLSGNTNSISVKNISTFVHSGVYGLDAIANSLGYITQNLSTAPGQTYQLSFWFLVTGSRSGQQFQANWNGATIYSTSSPPTSWSNQKFIVTATSPITQLQFGLNSASSFSRAFGLDDISVTPVNLPVITQPPASQTNFAGSNVVFTVAATGSAPLNYQWRTNGIKLVNGGGISGATTNLLTLTAVTPGSAGNYTVVITNAYGSVTSSVAALTVLAPPTFTGSVTNRTVECGANTNLFAITVSGTPPLKIQWNLDGTPVPNATNVTFAITNLSLPNHTVIVVVTNLYGSVASNAVLTVRDTTAPVLTLNGGNPFFLELGTAFTDPGATANDACAGSLPVSTSGSVNPNTVGTNILTYKADDGNGNTNTVTRSVIVRDTTPPAILWSFTNLVLAADINCSAPMPDVTGTNYILATDLSGALTVSQNPTNNSALQIGTNLVLITVADASDNVSYSTNTIVVQDQTPPLFLIQPQCQTNLFGTTANFSAAATACTPLAYQWFFNRAALTNATNGALAIIFVSTNNAGNYFVTASAGGGSTTSAVVTLAVNLIPPTFNGLAANHDGSFNLNLLGTPGFTYILETTTDLLSSAGWQPIATNTLGTNGVWQFDDTSATNFSQQFYRLKLMQ